jgi:hypothetical protein
MRATETKGQFFVFVMALAALITFAGCGKKEDNKKKASKPTITEGKVDADGKAIFSFSGSNTYCKFDTNDGEGEWYKCDGSTASYPLAPGQAGTFFVREGQNGPIQYQTVSNPTNPTYSQTDASQAADTQTAQVQAADIIPFFDNAGFIGLVNRKIQVPNGMYVTFYSTNNTLSTGLDVYQVDTNEDPFKRAVNCNAQAMVPNMTSETVLMQSVPNGPTHRYCNSVPTDAFQKSFNNYRAGLNQIELVTEAGQPFDYISMAVYTSQSLPWQPFNSKDESTTNSLFVAHCGNPMGQKAPNVMNRSSIPGLPFLNDYFPGFLPKTTVFNWCQKKITIRGKQGTVFVGGFKSLRQGQSSDMLEFVTISEMTQDIVDPNSFAQHSATKVLNSMGMSLPGHL